MKKTIKKIIQSKAIYSGFVLLASCGSNNETNKNQSSKSVELSSMAKKTRNTTSDKNGNVQNNSSAVTRNNNSANDGKNVSINQGSDEVKSKSFVQKHPKSIMATVGSGVITGTTLGILAGTLTTTASFFGMNVIVPVFPTLGATSLFGMAIGWAVIGLVGGVILGVVVSWLCTKWFPKLK